MGVVIRTFFDNLTRLLPGAIGFDRMATVVVGMPRTLDWPG